MFCVNKKIGNFYPRKSQGDQISEPVSNVNSYAVSIKHTTTTTKMFRKRHVHDMTNNVS